MFSKRQSVTAATPSRISRATIAAFTPPSGSFTASTFTTDLETYRGTKKGLVRNGKRVSIFEPEKPGQAPLLFESLMRRFDETSRDPRNPVTSGHGPGSAHRDGRPGMPLALPPLSIEQLSLVKTWLHQGAPGPVGKKLALRQQRDRSD